MRKKILSDISTVTDKTLDMVAPRFLNMLTQALLAMLTTAMSVIAVTNLIHYPGGLAAWVAGVLVATAASTGIEDFNTLYSGFSAAMIIMSILFVFTVHAFFPASDDPMDDDDQDLLVEIKRLKVSIVCMEEQMKFLYEREACREFGEVESD